MSERSAVTSRPVRRPMATIASARARASSTVRMNAPSPTFTSSTMASAPDASFLLMIEEAIRGRLPTVAVTSRSAYSLPSAGAICRVVPAMTRPTLRTWAINSSSLRSLRKPGMLSSLSMVPPVKPRPRPLILATGSPVAATIGPTTSVVLSPTPPDECLSTTRPKVERSNVSPLSTIASVSVVVSRSSIPRKRIAMSSALAW